MRKRYSIRIVKKEIKDIEVIFPTGITYEKVAAWANEIEEYLFEDASYSPEVTQERIGEKMMYIETQLQDEYTSFDITDIKEFEK